MHALFIGAGFPGMTFHNWKMAFLALGYRLDPSMKCAGTARIVTGDFAGINYPSLNYGLKHIGSGLSAFHIDCPRPNWEEVRELRGTNVLSPNGKWIVSA